MPVRKSGLPRAPKPKRNVRDEALARLFITDEDVRAYALITPIWKAAEGGVKQVIEALRSSEDPEARTFLEKYDSLTLTDRKLLTVEEVCIASGVETSRLRELGFTALCSQEDQASALMLATSKRKLIRKSLENAMQPKGWSDRENMLKATGVMPTPKGATLAIQTTFNTQNIAAPQDSRPLKTSEERMGIVQAAFEKKRLEAPKEPVIISAVDIGLSKRQEIVGNVLP